MPNISWGWLIVGLLVGTMFGSRIPVVNALAPK